MIIGNKKISLMQLIRLLVQITCFIFIPALFINALNGVKEIYTAVLDQNLSTALIPDLVEIIALIPITIFFGRFFCGWMCGFGSFTDFIYILSGKIFNRKYKISRNLDATLKYVKYVLLVVLLIFAWTLDLTIFNSLSPWDVFGMTAIVGTMPAIGTVISTLPIALLFFIIIIAASVFVERFFCRYLCPMGAIFALSSKLRIGKIKKPTEKCGKCRVCTNNCAMGIPLYEMEEVKSVECINCMKCISTCPRNNTSYAVAKKDLQPLIVSAVSVAVMTGSYYTVYSAANNTGIVSSTATTSQSQAASQLYADGTYEGTGTGFRGSVKVSVVISGGKITKITTVSSNEDAKYYDRAFSAVTKNIISTQSSSVDAVSGATYSSKGIMTAVESALVKAKAASTASNENATLETITKAAASSATTATTATDSVTASSAASSSNTGSTSNSATNSSNSSTTSTAASTTTTSAASATSGVYADGTYTGSGVGFRGTTKVSVVVSGGKITNITTVSTNDDAKYYNRAFSSVTSSIINTQSTKVDAVSGATYSSNGIMKAVASALTTAVK